MLATIQSQARQDEEKNASAGKVAPRTTPAPTRFEQLRRPLPPNALVLQPATIAWAKSLPFEVLPKSLLIDFPRIANQLAASWHSPRLTQQQLQALLLNDRPGRRGFPFKIVKELADLQAYFNEFCVARQDKEWRNMVVR